MKIAIYTLGCKVNQYESQAIEQALHYWTQCRGVDFNTAAGGEACADV